MGMTETLDESLAMLGQMRPIDLSLNMLTTNIMLGMLLGLPIAAMIRKSPKLGGGGSERTSANE